MLVEYSDVSSLVPEGLVSFKVAVNQLTYVPISSIRYVAAMVIPQFTVHFGERKIVWYIRGGMINRGTLKLIQTQGLYYLLIQ